MDITSYMMGKKVGGGGGGYTLPPATSNTLGGIKVGTNLSIDNSGVLSATDTTYTAGTNITISNENVISATGGGTPVEPTIISVDALTVAFLEAISPLCEYPEVPISSGGAWQDYPHLDIDSATYPEIYEACSTIFHDYDAGKITTNIYLLYQGHYVNWDIIPYGSYHAIVVKINDYVFAIYPHDDDIGQEEFTHPFYMVCTAVKGDGTLYPYYVMDVRLESSEISHTGGMGQFSTYTYNVDFTGFDAETVTHVTVLYYNLLEVLNSYGVAYSPSGNFYRGNELQHFLFYIRTEHFTTPVPVYKVVYSDYSNHSNLEFSSLNLNGEGIHGTIVLTDDGNISSFEYTEGFNDDRQA